MDKGRIELAALRRAKSGSREGLKKAVYESPIQRSLWCISRSLGDAEPGGRGVEWEGSACDLSTWRPNEHKFSSGIDVASELRKTKQMLFSAADDSNVILFIHHLFRITG